MTIRAHIILVFISQLIKGETNAINSSSLSNAADKPESLIKAKFNFTSNGSFSGEFGRVDNEGLKDGTYQKPNRLRMFNATDMESNVDVGSGLSTSQPALVDSDKEIMKELIANLINSNMKTGNRYSKRFIDDDDGYLVAFKPNLTSRNIPHKAPSIFDRNEKCVLDKDNWCKQETTTPVCTWETDCYCMSTFTCGPTKPNVEHLDKWCFATPDLHGPRTNLCQRRTTIPICTTTMYTPCASFVPPCVHPTANTIEPCVCQTTPPCPCPARFNGPDLFSLLFKRAARLPDPLRRRTIDLLNRHLKKRSVNGKKTVIIKK